MTLQEEVAEWADPIFGRIPRHQIIHLWEEVEEAFAGTLAISHEHNVPGLYAVQLELADIGLILLHTASTHDIVLTEASDAFAVVLRRKFEECKKREWKPRDDGIGVRHA